MGFWSTLGKIGLIAGGGIATALTAGAASPLLATAIGAGIGAGTGAGTAAIDHKSIWKGLATGAALGGATAGIGGALRGGKDVVSGLVGDGGNIVNGTKIATGLGQALKDTGTNLAASAIANGGVPTSAAAPGEGPYVQASDSPGFLDSLKKAGLQLVTDPKTGQVSFQKILGAAGNTAGAVAAGMSAGRDKEVSNYAAVNNADILQRRQAMDTQNNNYGNALRSALAMNIKDARYDPAGVPITHMQGGFRPSAFGPQGQLAAASLNAQAQKGLDNPQGYAPLPDTKAGALENTLGTAGTIAKGIGQLGEDQTQSGITALIKQLLAKQQGVGEEQS